MAKQAKNERRSANASFIRKYDEYEKCGAEDSSMSMAIKEKKFKELSDAWNVLEQRHDRYQSLLSDNDVDDSWIMDAQTKYNDAVKRHTVDSRQKAKEDTVKGVNLIELEQLKLPRFSGKISEYPRFKTDYQWYIQPNVPPETATYTLRTCLSNDAAHIVRNIDESTEEMWRILDDKYADPATVADNIIDGINKTKAFKDGECKRFVNFVDKLDDGYADLIKLGLQKEITTTSSVSIVEKKLPPMMKHEWAKLVSSEESTVDKSDKFPSLIKFLRNQKRAIEYETAALRSTESVGSNGTVNHTHGDNLSNESSLDGTDSRYKHCLFHSIGDHWTSDCQWYLSQPVHERITQLRKLGACLSCLKIGHRIRDCRYTRSCGINGCTGKHHSSTHLSDYDKPNQIPCNVSGNTCLLQLQNIRTTKGCVNALWDNGSSICLITYQKAREENLKGTKVNLSMVKVGGDSEVLESQRYTIELIDKCGQRVHITAYGIEKITSDIEHVHIDELSAMFKNVHEKEIKRPIGTVDLLIGYEYAGLHPEIEQKRGNLMLLRNRFGRCLGGSLPTTADDVQHVQMNRVNQVTVTEIKDVTEYAKEVHTQCDTAQTTKNINTNPTEKHIRVKKTADKRGYAAEQFVKKNKLEERNSRLAMAMSYSNSRGMTYHNSWIISCVFCCVVLSLLYGTVHSTPCLNQLMERDCDDLSQMSYRPTDTTIIDTEYSGPAIFWWAECFVGKTKSNE